MPKAVTTNRNDMTVLYAQLPTHKKRIAARLIRALAHGDSSKSDLSKICKSITRNTKLGQPKKSKSGYIMYYSKEYPNVKKTIGESASLGEIARVIASGWRSLSAEEKEQYNMQAKTENAQIHEEDDKS